MEIIPVAITRAKYPGNKSAAVRKTMFRWLVLELLIQRFVSAPRFFVVSILLCGFLCGFAPLRETPR